MDAVAERIKMRKTTTIAAGLIAASSFAGMVINAYTADHIKRSGCDMAKDDKLQRAYRWAWSSALLSAGVVIVSGTIIAATMLKKN